MEQKNVKELKQEQKEQKEQKVEVKKKTKKARKTRINAIRKALQKSGVVHMTNEKLNEYLLDMAMAPYMDDNGALDYISFMQEIRERHDVKTDKFVKPNFNF